MSECDDFRPRIVAFLDGELLPAEAAAVKAHLRACPACATAFGEYQALKKAIMVSPAPEPAAISAGISAAAKSPPVDMLEEIGKMRREMQALRDEIASLRREIARRPVDGPTRRSTVLDLPNAPARSSDRFRLV